MKQLIKKHKSKLKFIIVGSFNTLIDFCILIILSSIGLDKIISNYISTSVAFIFSFFANRNFTFKSKKSIKNQIIPFTATTLTGLWIIQPIIIGTLQPLLSSLLNSNEVSLVIAKLIATIASLIWNYLLYSKLVFKQES